MTPEEIKARQDKISARVEELKSYAGKFFVRRGDIKNVLVQVIGYAGVKTKDGISSHTFQVESKDARWTPAATQFLEEYEESTQTPKTALSEEIV